MIRNINYKGFVDPNLIKNVEFSNRKPCQFIDRSGIYTLIFFKSGKCRIMGCKSPINVKLLQYPILNIQIQSVTVSTDLGFNVNLYVLSNKLKHDGMFEPELFPALRYNKYNPLCVNIFSSGKIIILGLKSLNFNLIVKTIMEDIHNLVIQI
mgnify:FL=1